ncbi:MAG: hypothetical protein ABI462_14735 [Ignavibacteria bacterium]
MKTLYELAKVNQKHSKTIESLIPSDKFSPMKRLISILFAQQDLDDQSAMLEIYGKKNASAFSRLKTRLKDILIRTTLLQNINIDAAESRLNESHNQLRNSVISKLLIDLKVRNLSIDIAEKSIIKAIKYHATESILLLTRILVAHYGSNEFNKYKLNKYLDLQEKYLRVYDWEIRAENYFYDLQRLQLQSLAAPSDATKEKARRYVTELESVKNVNSYNFTLNKYRVKAINFEYQKDYASLLKLVDSVLNEFTSQFKSTTFIQNINLRKAWALIQAGRYNDTIEIGIKDLKKIPSGSVGWYIMAHYTLKALLYKGDYAQSIELISSMMENPKLQKIGENYKELFTTTLGYIHLVVDSGLAGDPKEISKKLPDFKLYKYLNTTPVFSRDKRGINLSILLMHIAYLLQRKDYNAIIDRLDSLNQYAYRYLRKDDSFRSNCMIKMVVQMSKADFNPIRTERYTKDLLNQLKEVKLAGSGENIETEIIPYEVLWEIMTKSQ